MWVLFGLVGVLVLWMMMKGADPSMSRVDAQRGDKHIYEEAMRNVKEDQSKGEGGKDERDERSLEEELLWEEGEKVTSEIVSKRYEYTWQRHSYLKIPGGQSQVDIEKLCLDRKELWCWKTALLASPDAMPSCITENLHVRSTFIYRNQSISVVEISKAMAATLKRSIFCPSGRPARIKLHSLTAYLDEAHPHLTHTMGFIKCWADSEDHPNAQGFIILNYLGNCSWPLPKQPLTLTSNSPINGLVRKTNALFFPTPISRSFMQSYPSLPSKALSQGILPVPDRIAHVPFQYTLCAMAAVIDTDAPFFNHWLWHLKYRVKIQHITMYYQPDAFHIDSPQINGTFVRELLQSGFLHLVPWYSHYSEGTQVFYRSQAMAYNDYIYRFRGLCLWTMYSDVDDFFVSWKTGHQLVPVITDVLQNDSYVTSIRMAWPPFMPRCQKLTGFQAPYTSDFLATLSFGNLTYTHMKYVDMGIYRDEVSIHYAVIHNVTRISAPGVAVYHARAGHPRLIQKDQYSHANCSIYELRGWDLNARANHVFGSQRGYPGSKEIFGKDGVHGFDPKD